jgi:flagellar export protein FliJ
MAETDPKKAARLVSFRKLERERASREVFAARAAVDSAQSAVEAQVKLIEQEVSEIPKGGGEVVSPEDMSLALACIEVARLELKTKEGFLNNAQQTLGVQADKLLAVHKKVRQMETLKAAAEEARNKVAHTKETREIDDLAQHREARK